MKIKLFSALLLATSLFYFSGVNASDLFDESGCFFVKVSSTGKDVTSGTREGLKILGSYGSAFIRDGSLIDSGYHNQYLPGPMIPNNNYSYSIITKDGPAIWSYGGRSILSERTRAFEARTNCPPAVSVRENLLKEDVLPSVDMSGDSALIKIDILDKGQTYIALGINLDDFKVGEYKINSAVKKGTLNIFGETFLWFGESWYANFNCVDSSCDDIASLKTELSYNFPTYGRLMLGDTRYGDTSFYPCEKSCSFEVYNIVPSSEKIIIKGDQYYDLLRNGKEIAVKIPISQKGHIDSGLDPGTSYAYTVRAPSIYSRENATSIPEEYSPVGIKVMASGVSLQKKPIALANPQIKSVTTKTNGDFIKKASVVLDINISNNTSGEYRYPGYIYQTSWSGGTGKVACLSINRIPENCIWDWVPEKVVSVAADKTYDILRDGKEVATRISLAQKTFLDSNLLTGTLYTYTVRAPSIHSRDGLVNIKLGNEDAPIAAAPALASPAITKVEIMTRVPDEKLKEKIIPIDEVIPSLEDLLRKFLDGNKDSTKDSDGSLDGNGDLKIKEVIP